MSTTAQVTMWGRTIGAVTLDQAGAAAFQYTPGFARSGIEVAPVTMPLSDRVYVFSGLSLQTFKGLPGMLADVLPDRFGNALINTWLARQGRAAGEFNAVERLCYTGSRGMGALEFAPALGPHRGQANAVDVQALVELASRVLRERRGVRGPLSGPSADTPSDTAHDADDSALRDILRVGTSAGGARAKAVIAWNPATDEVRSGQVAGDALPSGFEHWLLKFDGVSANRDKELDDPQGYGAIEYAYHLMARSAGIAMNDCRLLEEGGRRHFMTRRFDRTADGKKLHMQSLCALGHHDFNAAGATGYEQALQMIRTLGLPMAAIEEQFRRMVFNLVARNQDDHTKNIAFLMDKTGRWSLAPAYDVAYAYNPHGDWTASHQMTVNGKRDGFEFADLDAVAKNVSMKRGRARAILNEVLHAVRAWPGFADQSGVDPNTAHSLQPAFRLNW